MKDKEISYRPLIKKVIVLFILIFLFIGFCYAKRMEGYVPPPFSYRLLCSFIVLTPFAILTLALSYLYFKLVDKLVGKIIFLKLFVAMIFTLIICCLLAASDSYNDEGTNPVSMAILLTIYIPFVIPILGKKLKLWVRTMIGIGFLIILVFVIGYLEVPFHDLLLKTNLPTTW